jgi:hypothetical protein
MCRAYVEAREVSIDMALFSEKPQQQQHGGLSAAATPLHLQHACSTTV